MWFDLNLNKNIKGHIQNIFEPFLTPSLQMSSLKMPYKNCNGALLSSELMANNHAPWIAEFNTRVVSI